MPGNSWRDRLGIKGSSSEETLPSKGTDFSSTLTNNNIGSLKNVDATQLSPELARLMQQREQLEERMRSLTGNNSTSQSQFPVTTLKERREEFSLWEKKRSAQSGNHSKLTESSLAQAGKKKNTRETLRSSLTDFSKTPDLLPLKSFTRDTLSEKLDIKTPLEKAKNTTEQLIRESAITHQWKEKVSRVQDDLDATKSYEKKRNRLLNIATGGSGDLDLLAERNRQRLINVKREQKKIDEQEQLKRSRALSRKKLKE